MTRELQKLIKHFKPIINSDYFVITNEPKPTEPRTYRNYYKQFIKDLGISELKFHGLRHSFATRCIEGKCDCKTVSVLLGHSNMEQKKKCIDQMFKALR